MIRWCRESGLGLDVTLITITGESLKVTCFLVSLVIPGYVAHNTHKRKNTCLLLVLNPFLTTTKRLWSITRYHRAGLREYFESRLRFPKIADKGS